MIQFKVLMFAIVLLGQANNCFSSVDDQIYEEDYYTISETEVREIPADEIGNLKSLKGFQSISGSQFDPYTALYPVDPLDQVARVIAVARDLVALGEDVYRLVQKGKPTNNVNYTPISVIPNVNGGPVDILETEFWKTPIKRTYEVAFKNLYGNEVASYRYTVIFSYGGTYKGKGAYLTSVQIVPEKVKTLFGFDFTATMKLGGIQNQGTRENPIAAATLLMEYSVSSVFSSRQRVDSFFVMGNGQFKKF